jgi:hypothetical protein
LGFLLKVGLDNLGSTKGEANVAQVQPLGVLNEPVGDIGLGRVWLVVVDQPAMSPPV